MEYPSDVAFTTTVKELQAIHGSREGYASMEKKGGWETSVTSELSDFLQRSDMFYLGTSNLDGQPYIQYRGGPMGFLKIVDDTTLGFADFAGNKQFISTGNLNDNSKAFIFLMDYEHRRRIKIWGNAKVIKNDSSLLAYLTDLSYPGKAERAVLFKISAWNSNCPLHIHERLSKEKAEKEIEILRSRVRQLEEKLADSKK